MKKKLFFALVVVIVAIVTSIPATALAVTYKPSPTVRSSGRVRLAPNTAYMVLPPGAVSGGVFRADSIDSVTSAGHKIKYFPDGSFAVTSIRVAAPRINSTNGLVLASFMPASTGGGGTSSHVGSRNAWVQTDYWSLGTKRLSYKTGVHWEWHNGVVTRVSWNAPTYKTYAYMIYYEGTTFGPSIWQTYGGKSHGQNYRWVTGKFVVEITKFGKLAQYDPTHQYWVRGNGTWRWAAQE